MTERVKIGAAALLLVCVVLPFSSCSRQVDARGRAVEVSQRPAVETVTDYRYVWEDFHAGEFADWLFLLCFIWPIPVLIHRHKRGGGRLGKVLWALEPLLLGASSYYVWVLSHILAAPALGAHLVHAGNLAYGTAWAAEALDKVRAKKPG